MDSKPTDDGVPLTVRLPDDQLLALMAAFMRVPTPSSHGAVELAKGILLAINSSTTTPSPSNS